MNGQDSIEDARRQLEKIFGYPKGAFDPKANFFSDVERVNKALGEGFQLMQQVIDPLTLRDRIEALHPDQAPLGLQQAAKDIFNLPRKIWEIRPPDGGHSNGGR